MGYFGQQLQAERVSYGLYFDLALRGPTKECPGMPENARELGKNARRKLR